MKLRQRLLQEKLHEQIRVDVIVVTDDVNIVTLKRLGNGKRSVACKFRSNRRRDVKPESRKHTYMYVYNAEARAASHKTFLLPDSSHALSLQD